MKSEDFYNKTPIFLQIGLQLKIEIEGVSMPMESILVGVDGKFIIIRTPSPYQLIEHKLTRGREFIIRYIFDGTVFAFQTKLFESIMQPARLLFLEYPKIIQKNELRDQKRSKCFIPIKISLTGEENRGVLLDITMEGCFCKISKKENNGLISFKIDDEILLLCKFPGIKGQVQICGIVKNLRKNKQELELGINFHNNITAVSKKIISWYISTIENFVSSQEMRYP